LIRVVYSSDPVEAMRSEINSVTHIIEELNSKFGFNINIDDAFSSKRSENLRFFFEFDKKMLDSSIILATYISSINIDGDFKSQRLFELIGYTIGENLVKFHEPSSPSELFALLAEYFENAGFGSMKLTELEERGKNASLFSLEFTNVPFAGLLQSRVLSILIQNIVKGAYINFTGQLTVFSKITKSWDMGDDNLVLEVGLMDL
jgi:hypothetical protein